jgi:hypothetical protein
MPVLMKPATPRIAGARPRGLMVSTALTPGFINFAGGPLINLAPTLTNIAYRTSYLGQGLSIAANSECVAYKLLSGQPPTTYSMEMMFVVVANTANGTFCGWSDNSTGTGAAFDRQIYNTFDMWTVSHYDGATKEATGGTRPAGNLVKVHLIGTYDGSNLLTLYQNGNQVAQTSGVGAPYTGYANPHFCVGRVRSALNSYNSAIILLCNFARVCWTPTEVKERFVDPFGMFYPPPPALAFNTVAATKATPPFRQRPLRIWSRAA